MKRGKIVTLLAMVMVTVLTAGFVVLTQKSETKSAPADFWSKRITACEDKTLVDTAEVLDHSYDCLKTAIKDAIFSRSFPAFVEAAEPIMAHDIRFEYVCHIPAHDVGQDVVEFYKGDYRQAILDLGYSICGSGFVHGVYDVWGRTAHTKQEWVRIGGYCETAVKVRYNACGDAIGHAAYESAGRDLAQAMLICDWQNAEMIQTPCSNGAYMQANFPQSTKLKKERDPVLKDPAEWSNFVTFCDTVPFETTGARAGCYYGAGWVMGNNIYMDLQKLRTQDFDEFKSTPEMDKEVLRLIDIAIDACETGAVNDQNVIHGCIYIMLARMPLFFYMDTPKFETFCRESVAGFPESLFTECLASGHEHMNPEEMRKLVDKYPALEPVLIRRVLPVPPPNK